MKFVIAVQKENPVIWLDLTYRAPLEEEVLSPDWFLFDIEAENLLEATMKAMLRADKELGRYRYFRHVGGFLGKVGLGGKDMNQDQDRYEIKQVIEECPACGGAGIYVGLAERGGAGVVCRVCKGDGFVIHRYKVFEGRRIRKDVKRVYEWNPGFIIGETEKLKLEDFGGIPYEEWLREQPQPFPLGSEMRRYVCPKWWSGQSWSYDKCEGLLAGQTFPSCPYFAEKEKCWEEYDKSYNK